MTRAATGRWLVTALCLAAGPRAGHADETGITGDALQAPSLAAAQRGSLVGTYAGIRGDAAALGRGALTLPGPFTAPTDRGPLLIGPFPGYSSEYGISEYGIGWSTSLALTRWRGRGEIDFQTDDLLSPWGRLVAGTGGVFGPAGLAVKALVVPSSDGTAFTAYLGDGTRWQFGGAAATTVVVPGRGTAAWYLTQVVDREGHVTQLTWAPNASGRPFLSSVSYGGHADTPAAYRIAYHYEPLATVFGDLSLGRALQLDRRVDQIALYATVPGGEVLRWRYALQYAGEAPAPGFYLAQVTRTFASGASPPPVRYTYGSSRAVLASTGAVPDPALDGLLARFPDITSPQRTALVDSDRDGRLDFEDHASNAILRRADGGFVEEPLGPVPGGVRPECRPAAFVVPAVAPPRQLVRLGPEDGPLRVMAFLAGTTQTTVEVCTRDGVAISQASVPGALVPGAVTRFVDINRDQVPDLVHISPGRVTVIEGSRDAAGGWQPGATHQTAISPVVSASAMWVQDLNGDGVADVVARSGSALFVWLGAGGGQVTPAGATFPALGLAGTAIALGSYQVNFIDANHDGLVDLLLIASSGNRLVLNVGGGFQEVAVPALAMPAVTQGPPVAADLGASGGHAIHVMRDGHARSIALDAPEVGLLTSADDGAGTQLTMAYTWAPAVPGLVTRRAQLRTLTSTAPGRAATTAQLDYALPVRHSADGYFLGYGSVTRSDERGVHQVALLDTDRYAGLVLATVEREAAEPLVEHVELRSYDDASYTGVAWARPASVTRGWRLAGGGAAVTEETDYTAYDGVCATAIVEHRRDATLTTGVTRAQPAALAAFPHCLPAAIVRTGRHADASLDFSSTRRFDRDDLGFPTRISDEADGDALVQLATYDARHRLVALARTGLGTTQASYDALGLLASVTAPDGSVIEAVARDPATDATTAMRTQHGVLDYAEYFAYDGRERLAARWDGEGASSPAQPLERHDYRDAGGDLPAAVTTYRLVDPGAGIVTSTIDLTTPAGDPITTAHLGLAGWALAPITWRDRAGGHASIRRSAAAEASSPLALTATDLAGLGLPTGDAEIGFADQVVRDDRLVEGAVHHIVTTELELSPDGDPARGVVVRTRRDAGAIVAIDQLDAAGRVIAHQAPDGATQQYRYDALRRLRDVTLETGAHHTVRYDSLGRIVRIARDGGAAVQRGYVPGTALVAREDRTAAGGALVTTTTWQYDAIGRTVIEHAVTGDHVDELQRYYDGATPDQPALRTMPGVLSAVTGDSFVRRLSYRDDASLARQIIAIDGWRTIDVSEERWADRRTRSRTVRVQGGDAGVIYDHTTGFPIDATGADAGRTLDGAPLVGLVLSDDGLPLVAELPRGGALWLSRDPVTRGVLATSHVEATWATGEDIAHDERGLVAHQALSSGDATRARDYEYDALGQLITATGDDATYRYAYDRTGLVTAATERDPGAVAFDALGRVTRAGDVTVAYGARDQVIAAQRGDAAATYAYDENGQRLIRRSAGARQAMAAGVYVDDRTVIELVEVAGRVVGVVQDGAFRPLGVDARGSVVSDLDGSPRWATPYGVRGPGQAPALAAVLDVATGRRDDLLGTQRLGVRDYDPGLQRFWTPDPVFFEHPEQCVVSPLECNLYGYARGNPVSVVDPTGTRGETEGETTDETATSPEARGESLARMHESLEHAEPYVTAVELGHMALHLLEHQLEAPWLAAASQQLGPALGGVNLAMGGLQLVSAFQEGRRSGFLGPASDMVHGALTYGSGLSAILGASSLSLVLSSGAIGFGLGSWMDRRFQLSDRIVESALPRDDGPPGRYGICEPSGLEHGGDAYPDMWGTWHGDPQYFPDWARPK